MTDSSNPSMNQGAHHSGNTVATDAVDDMALEVFRGRDGVLALADAWRGLASRCASHYLHLPEWYLQKVSHLDAHPQQALFMAYYQNGQLVAVVPLKLETVDIPLGPLSQSLPVLSLYYPDEMGVCDAVVEPLLRNSRFFGRLLTDIKGLKEYWLLVLFKHLPASGHGLTLMAGGELFGPLVRPSHPSKYLPTTMPYEAVMAAYPKKFLRNLRRKQNKLDGMGAVHYRFLRDANSLPQAFEKFLEVEASGWKGKRGSAIREQPERRAFYEDLMHSLMPGGQFGVHLLELDGEPIAAQLAIYVHRSVYLLKIGYDEKYNAVSPGFLLVNGLLEHACASEAIDRVSFVTGTGWMDVWKPAVEQVYVAYCGRYPLLNLMLRGAVWLQGKTKKIIGKKSN